MKKVITYGTFDLFHQGHYNLLRRAKDLGDYLIVGVTTDNFDLERGKMNTCHNVMERIEAVRATGLADQIVIEEYKGQKIDDILRYKVDIFAIGSDWTGHFDYLKEFCEVIYLPRTEGVSSTQLRKERSATNIGIIGTGNIAARFCDEARYVNNAVLAAAYNTDNEATDAFCSKFGITTAASAIGQLFDNCDAVYIATPYFTQTNYVKAALEAGKHVLCETPFVRTEAEAEELFSLANEKHLLLMMALKTAYCPAFGHLFTLLKSGVIGDIVEINTTSTTLREEDDYLSGKRYGGSMIENGCFTLLPIFKFLGTDFRNINFYSREKDGIDQFTKAVIRFDHAVASFQVGLGVKTEGCMTIAGTKGYVFVPAPWWKTDYFEVRYEDQNQNKKYFYPYVGEGLRYEIKDFVTAILNHETQISKLNKKEILAMARVQELFSQRRNLYVL